jgi:hypothetical protein
MSGRVIESIFLVDFKLSPDMIRRLLGDLVGVMLQVRSLIRGARCGFLQGAMPKSGSCGRMAPILSSLGCALGGENISRRIFLFGGTVDEIVKESWLAILGVL